MKIINSIVSSALNGRFQRVLDLPADAKDEDIKASFKNGILTVRVPRSEQAKAARREIPIQ